MDPDVVVIGGGAGGLGAARAANRRGARTLLVQHGPIGGDCTFTGCVPSKALIAAAARGSAFPAAMTAVHHAVAAVARTEDDQVLAGEGIDVVHGWASFRDPRTLDIDGRTVRARHYVLATGARPAVPPIPGLDAVEPLTNETVFDLDARPDRLVVLGGGAIGCELAQALARLGVTVTVVEALDRVLAREEPETSAVVAGALRADGVDVRTGQPVSRVEPSERGRPVRLCLADGTTVDADRVLVAAGRRGSVDDLGLEEAGVAVERGYVRTDDHLRTTQKGIWAVGDVTGRLQLTHAADEMGRVAVGNALGRRRRRFDARAIPWAVFTAPEVGRVGLTEEQAVERGARVAYVPLTEVDRAIATGETEGFVKLIAGPRPILGDAGGGQILGATVVAPTGGDLVHEAALAMRTRMFAGRLAQTVHAYPTWSVAIRQAAAQLFMETGGRRARAARR